MTSELKKVSCVQEESYDRSPNITSRTSRDMFPIVGEVRSFGRHPSTREVLSPQRLHRKPCPVHHSSRRSRAPSLIGDARSIKPKCPSDHDFSGVARKLQGLLTPNSDYYKQSELDKMSSKSYWTDKMASQSEESSPCAFCPSGSGEQTTDVEGKRRSVSLPKSPRALLRLDSTKYQTLNPPLNQKTKAKTSNAQIEQCAYQQKETYVDLIQSKPELEASQFSKASSPSQNLIVTTKRMQQSKTTELNTSSGEKVDSEGFGDSNAKSVLTYKCGCPVHPKDSSNYQCLESGNKNEDSGDDKCHNLGKINDVSKKNQRDNFGNSYYKAFMGSKKFEKKNDASKNKQYNDSLNKNYEGFESGNCDAQYMMSSDQVYEAESDAECSPKNEDSQGDKCYDFEKENQQNDFGKSYYEGFSETRKFDTQQKISNNSGYEAKSGADCCSVGEGCRDGKYHKFGNRNDASKNNNQCYDIGNRQYVKFMEPWEIDAQQMMSNNRVHGARNDPTYNPKNDVPMDYRYYEFGNKYEATNQCDDFENKNYEGFVDSREFQPQQMSNNRVHGAEHGGYGSSSTTPLSRKVTTDTCQPQCAEVPKSDAQDLKNQTRKPKTSAMNVCLKLVKKDNGEFCLLKDDNCGCGNHE